MKISKLFHWLYFFIMSLPLVVIPIFGIYSHRHTIDTYSVTRDENVIVQIPYTNSFNNSNGIWSDTSDVTDFTYLTLNNGLYVGCVSSQDDENAGFELSHNVSVVSGHKYYFVTEFTVYGVSNLSIEFYATDFENNFIEDVFDITNSSYTPIDFLGTFDTNTFYCSFSYYSSTANQVYFRPLALFDLTSIFGVGNEPTSLNECLNLFDTWYYQYGVTYYFTEESTVSVTYDNTDIGSQLTYAIYTPLHDYYNFNNFSTFNDVYNWIQLTFFNGNAPLGFFIVWECMCYWLMISIFWLIFDIFLYVPMLAHRWLDKASLS